MEVAVPAACCGSGGRRDAAEPRRWERSRGRAGRCGGS